VLVTLETSGMSVLKQTLAPLTARRIPDEPVLEDHVSTPAVEVLTLYRSRDYRLVELGRGCPACRLYAADIRPTRSDATILDVAVVSSGGSGNWQRCPAALKCGVPEFSPLDQRNFSGCAGQSACRVWRLAEDEGEARDAIQITYQSKEATCRNCPEGMDYATAHDRWEAAKAEGAAGCEVVPDSPVQILGKKSPSVR
jgi:hypothetical protein